MPAIALRSKVRTALEHCSLSLNIRHRLLLGQSSDIVFDMKHTLPEAVDVLLLSNLLITVSGSLDGTRIMPVELKASHIARHLVDFLLTNAAELGINAVSDLYISEDAHLLSLTLTASRHFPSTDALPVHLKLIALDLDYVWQTNSAASDRFDTAIHPFARQLSLPYLTATDDAVGRFVKFHLVRRYPLIFGPWCKQLDIEYSFFPSIFTSIQNIMERSQSPVFRATCQNLLKLCKREIMSASISTAAALSKYLGLEAGTYSIPAIRTFNEEEAVFLCLEHFYRLGMKRTNFRHLSLAPTISRASSEDLLTDTLVPDSFGINRSSNQLSEPSGLPPHLFLFEGTTDGSSDLELNIEDDCHMTPPNPYQNQNNASQQSPDQTSHLVGTPFNAKWTEILDQDLYDDYNLSGDEIGQCATLEQRPLNKDHRLNGYSLDLAVDLDVVCLLEEPDGDWPINNHPDWSPDSLSSQEYERDYLGKVPSPRADSMPPPLKMPASLYLPTAFENILDPLHSEYGEYGLPNLGDLRKHDPNALANSCIAPCKVPVSTQFKDAYLVSQEALSGDHYFELESDMEIDLAPDLVSKPVIDGDHGIIAFDFAPSHPSPSQAFISRNGALPLFSDQHSGMLMCGYRGGPAGVIADEDYRFFAVEYDSDVAA